MNGTPCLSLWERWLSEAKTERGNQALSVTCGDSSPRGRAKGLLLEREMERICTDALHSLFYDRT